MCGCVLATIIESMFIDDLNLEYTDTGEDM